MAAHSRTDMPNSKSQRPFAGLESKFLSGKVVKWSLPAMEPPFDPQAPSLKRLLLPQGELAQVYDADEPIRYIACLDLLPGTVRGNHYHKVRRELVYLMRGELSLIVRDVETGGRGTVSLRLGELVLIEPGIAHAMVISAPGMAVEFAQTRFDPEDTHRYLCAEV